MDKCPKCGEDAYGFINATGAGIYKCGSTDHGFDPERPEPFVSRLCLRRQLAAAQAKLEESARLATDSAKLADSLAKDLAAANERAGRLEEQMVELREAFKSCEYVDDTASMVALEMLESDYDTFTRIIGGA